MNRKFYFFKIKQLFFCVIGFKYLIKYHLKYSLSSFWILIGPFIGFLILSDNRKNIEISSWCCITEVIVQPDPSRVHLSPLTLNKSWLCWISSISSILVFFQFLIKPWFCKYFILNRRSCKIKLFIMIFRIYMLWTLFRKNMYFNKI